MNSLARRERRASAWWTIEIVMLTSVLTLSGAQSGVLAATLEYHSYSYDQAGNVEAITDPLNGNQSFTYDDLNRLTLANGPYGASGANASFAYSYNEIGNMLVNPQVGAYSYPAPGSVRPHAVSVAGPYPVTYDNNGNAITMTDPTGFYGYNGSFDAENRLSSVTTTYGGVPTTTTFAYDGDGGRVKKIVGTTTTRYISKLYECDTTGGTTSCSRFIWAGNIRIATVASNGVVHYWHGDHLGSSSVITDSTGAKVQAITYFPYGDIRTKQSFTTPAVDVPYKYTGKELDASSNLYFYESRYYHALFGRFTSPDTIVESLSNPQLLNRYSYVGNNPLRYTDPSGHCFIVCVTIKSINIGKALRRGLGDVGVTVLGTALQFAGPFGSVTNFVLGGAVLTQSKSGRYVLAGEIVGATTAAAVVCIAGTGGGCGALALPIYGAAIGATSGAFLGGYSAARNGGDLSSGILFGAGVGAATGAITGYGNSFVEAPLFATFGSAPLEYLLDAGIFAGVSLVNGAVLNAGTGAITAYAGGRGQVGRIFSSAGKSGLSAFSPEGAAMSAGSLLLGGGGPLGDNIELFNFRVARNLTVSLAIPVSEGVRDFVRNANAAYHVIDQVNASLVRPDAFNYAHFNKEFAPQ